MIFPRKHKVSAIRDLGVVPHSVLAVGVRAMVSQSHAGGVMYASAGPIRTEFQAGDHVKLEPISVSNIAAFTGMTYAGRNAEDNDVFMSTSSALHTSVPSVELDHRMYDTEGPSNSAKAAAIAEASQLDFLMSVIESTSAAAKNVFRYKGKPVVIDDAHDEYELELTSSSRITFSYVDKDIYELTDKSSPRIKFIIRGHARAFSLMAMLEPEKDGKIGQVANDKTKTFKAVGYVKKRIVKPFPMREGTVVYEYRKRYYLDNNLSVPLDKALPKPMIAQLIKRLSTDAPLNDYVNGRLVSSTPVVETRFTKPRAGEKPKEVAIPETKAEPVFGAHFPVSANTPNRSRVLFGASQADVESRAREIIGRQPIVVDYYTFETNTSNAMYLDSQDSPNAVMIRATGTLQNAFPRATKVNLVAEAELHRRPTYATYVEPITGAPAPTESLNYHNMKRVNTFLNRLLHEGYFNTGVRVIESKDNTGLRFAAPSMSDDVYNQVSGIGRRIYQYLMANGVPVERVRVARGKRAAEIRFVLSKLPEENMRAISELERQKPKLNVPVYTTIKPKMGTVSIRSYNIHTGECECQEQHADVYREGRFTTLFTNLERAAL